MLAHEHAGEWAIMRLDDDALSRPLPELGLSRPELFGVTTDYQGSVLPFLFLLFFLFFLLFDFSQCVHLFPFC